MTRPEGLPRGSGGQVVGQDAGAAPSFRCGYAALVGRPNVGKSTLLNSLLGQKLSITASKPQTTRYRIQGIKTTPAAQTIYVDTPGLHEPDGRAMNRYLNRLASGILAEVDVVVIVARALQWTEGDESVLSRLDGLSAPVVLAINQVDRVRDKSLLLPHLQRLEVAYPFRHLVPVSALRGDNVEVLARCVEEILPLGPALYPEDQVTDRSERFLAAELIREKLTRALGDELPYALSVEIEEFSERAGARRIRALIWVERPGQKAIVIGSKGTQLKEVGRAAREEMEGLLGAKVYLELWVKVRQGWSKDDRALKGLGYDEA
jgi:GTP-binding protein Era